MVSFLSFLWNIKFWVKFFTVLTLLALSFSYLAPFIHPKTQFFIPFFGLAYPIFLAISIILLILWTILKSKWAFVILGFLVLGGNLHFRMLAIFSDDSPPSGNSLHIMSYNVRLFDVYNPKLKNAIKTRNEIFD